MCMSRLVCSALHCPAATSCTALTLACAFTNTRPTHSYDGDDTDDDDDEPASSPEAGAAASSAEPMDDSGNE